jgi:hypothetical protein
MSPVPRASSAASVVSSVALATGTTTLVVVVEVAPELAAGDMPQTPEEVPEDMLEESEEEPEMVSEPVPEVVPVEGAMIITHAAAPSPPHGVAEASSSAPRVAAAADATTVVVREPEVVMGHPTFHAPDDIPLDEAMSMARRALSQVQRVLRWDDEDLTDERRCLQLWATMLKETMTTERAATRAQ